MVDYILFLIILFCCFQDFNTVISSENVTFRNPRKADSLTDDSGDDASLFNATMRSLPNTSLNCSENTSELSEKVLFLTNELTVAHQEIENLNEEMSSLKSELQRCLRTIEAYKKVNTPEHKTPKSSEKSNKHRKRLRTTPLQNVQLTSCPTSTQKCAGSGTSTSSYTELPLRATSDETHPPCKKPQELSELSTDISTVSELNTDVQSQCLNEECDRVLLRTSNANIEMAQRAQTIKEQCTRFSVGSTKRKIIVIADDQGRNFRRNFQKLVGEDFLVSCFWKHKKFFGQNAKQYQN